MKWAPAALLLAVMLPTGRTFAKTSLVVPYSFESVWPGALRFVRVEHNWKVQEQDKEAGFIRFQLIDDKKPHPATLELIRTHDDVDREAVRLQLRTADMARFQEAPFLSELARKLGEELGPPPAPKPKHEEKAKEKPTPDAGADGS